MRRHGVLLRGDPLLPNPDPPPPSPDLRRELLPPPLRLRRHLLRRLRRRLRRSPRSTLLSLSLMLEIGGFDLIGHFVFVATGVEIGGLVIDFGRFRYQEASVGMQSVS